MIQMTMMNKTNKTLWYFYLWFILFVLFCKIYRIKKLAEKMIVFLEKCHIYCLVVWAKVWTNFFAVTFFSTINSGNTNDVLQTVAPTTLAPRRHLLHDDTCSPIIHRFTGEDESEGEHKDVDKSMDEGKGKVRAKVKWGWRRGCYLNWAFFWFIFVCSKP